MRKLELIRGKVTDLIVRKGSADPVFSQAEKNTAGVAAVVAIVAEQTFNSTVFANASNGADIDVEYFTCTVECVPLSGHLYRVEFGNGDEMEFVVEKMRGQCIVQGARSTANRLIWMLPYQTRGTEAQQQNNRKWRYIASFFCAAIPTAVLRFMLPAASHPPIFFFPTIFLGMFITMLAISFLITARFREFSVMATEVLRAFGYENPASVDLPALSKEAERKSRREKETPPQLFQPWRFHY